MDNTSTLVLTSGKVYYFPSCTSDVWRTRSHLWRTATGFVLVIAWVWLKVDLIGKHVRSCLWLTFVEPSLILRWRNAFELIRGGSTYAKWVKWTYDISVKTQLIHNEVMWKVAAAIVYLIDIICHNLSKSVGKNRDENGAMGNGREPVRPPEKWGNLGRSKGGSDSDGYETNKAGMVWTRQKERWNWKHPSSCRNEDGGEAP